MDGNTSDGCLGDLLPPVALTSPFLLLLALPLETGSGVDVARPGALKWKIS